MWWLVMIMNTRVSFLFQMFPFEFEIIMVD